MKNGAKDCRKIGSSNRAKYYIKGEAWALKRMGSGTFSRLKDFIHLFMWRLGDSLDVLVPSDSGCGRDKSKNMTSAILFHCKPEAGAGIPEFLLEADGCQYLFVWHTDKVCELL